MWIGILHNLYKNHTIQRTLISRKRSCNLKQRQGHRGPPTQPICFFKGKLLFVLCRILKNNDQQHSGTTHVRLCHVSFFEQEIMNYFTYKATKTVLYQLYEMNPPAYTWLYNYLVVNDAKEGIHFLRALTKERQDLAERVMITRLHLYGRWIKKCDHTKMYERISNENLALMRERLMETVVWPTDDTNNSGKQD